MGQHETIKNLKLHKTIENSIETPATLQFPDIYYISKRRKLNEIRKLEHPRLNKKIIMAPKIESFQYSAPKFEGVCIETGTVKSVCGIDQLTIF